MAVASRKVGKYVRNLTLVSKTVNDHDYKNHGKTEQIYIDFFFEDKDGNRIEIKGNEHLLTEDEIEILKYYGYDF